MAINHVEKSLIASMRARMPAVLVGPPGTGKTAKMYEISDKLSYEMITLIGSQLDPTDIVGLPKGENVGNDENGDPIFGTVNLAPWWQVKILTSKKIILFLDEMTNTSPAVRASMLTMLQNREFPNGKKMPKETIVVGAMNPAEEAADGNELDTPTTNRINFLVWSPTLNEWHEGMLNAWGKSVSDKEMVWREKIVKFIKANPGELQKPPSTISSPEAYGVDPGDASEMEVLRYAWASRRSWDNLSRVLVYADADTVVEDTLAQGIVGYAAAAKLRNWLKRNSEITVTEVLNDPSIVKWKTVKPDIANELLSSIVDLSSDTENVDKALSVFEELANQDQASLGAPFIREFLANARKGASSPAHQKEIMTRLKVLASSFQKVAAAMR